MKTKNVNIIVRVPDDLYAAMKEKSAETGVAYSFVARRALENWVATGILPARVAPAPTPQEAGHADETQTE